VFTVFGVLLCLYAAGCERCEARQVVSWLACFLHYQAFACLLCLLGMSRIEIRGLFGYGLFPLPLGLETLCESVESYSDASTPSQTSSAENNGNRIERTPTRFASAAAAAAAAAAGRSVVPGEQNQARHADRRHVHAQNLYGSTRSTVIYRRNSVSHVVARFIFP
jgi:hypothetical protein